MATDKVHSNQSESVRYHYAISRLIAERAQCPTAKRTIADVYFRQTLLGGRGSIDDRVALRQKMQMDIGDMVLGGRNELIGQAGASDQEAIREPGIYQYQSTSQSSSFAVNLNESESRTEPLDDEVLAGYGVLLGGNITTAERLENQRQLRDRELESQQRLWQWILVLALAVLGLETLLGTLWSRRGKAERVPAVETG